MQGTSKGSDLTARMIGWSDHLLVAHTILLEISCRGLNLDEHCANIQYIHPSDSRHCCFQLIIIKASRSSAQNCSLESPWFKQIF